MAEVLSGVGRDGRNRAASDGFQGRPGSAVVEAALYVRYNGGQQYIDPDTGEHAPRDTESFYVDENGDRLIAEPLGWAEGDEAGVRLYTSHGTEVGTVVGTPGDRRDGFTTSAGNYATATFSTRQYTLIARTYFDGASFVSPYESLFISGESGAKAQFYGASTVLRLRIWDGAAARANSQILASTIGTGWRYVVATVDALTAGTTYLAVYDDDGAFIDSDTATEAAGVVDTANLYGLGAFPGQPGDYPWLQQITDVLGLDGEAKTPAECAAIVSDLADGTTTIDDYAATFSLPSDGLVSGGYTEAAPTRLYTLSGSGAAPTIERTGLSGTLYARHNGGMDLTDGSGALWTDAEDMLLSPATAKRILGEGWVKPGDEVGAPGLYDAGSDDVLGEVVGLPFTARMSGFDAFTDADHVRFDFVGPSFTFLADSELPASYANYRTLFSSPNSSGLERAALNNFPSGTWRVLTEDPPDGTDDVQASGLTQGDRYHLLGAYDSTDGRKLARAWDTSGTPQASDTDTRAASTPSLAGSWFMGRFVAVSYTWATATAHLVACWDGEAKTAAQGDTLSSALAAGATAADLVSTHGATWASPGGTTGVLDADDGTALYYQTGAGDAPTAELATSTAPGGYHRAKLGADEGEHLEGPTFACANDSTMLFFGDIRAIGSTNGFLCGAVGSTTSTGGMRLELASATSLQVVYRHPSSGAGLTATHTISDATTAGRRLHYCVSETGQGVRVGVGDWAAADYGALNANLPQTATTDEEVTFLHGNANLADVNRSTAGAGCWALYIHRLLTAEEWTAAAAGDLSWAFGDADVEWIFHPTASASVDDEVVAATNRTDGGAYTVQHAGGGTPVPLVVGVAA